VIGINISILLTGATALINQVIGVYATSGAFVFGVYSFAEKIINGILIMAISSELDKGSAYFINTVNFIIPVISLMVSLIIVYIQLDIPQFDPNDFDYIYKKFDEEFVNIELSRRNSDEIN